MKKTTFLSIVLISLILGACNSSSNKNEQTHSINSAKTKGGSTSQTFNLDTAKLKKGDVFYQCEMDPEILSDKPGNCPKCEMELSEIKK